MRHGVQLLDVILETPEFLAVNKPQDLVCHPTKGDAYSSLISRARLYLNGPAFLVNRLDRETSGVTLIAKSGEIAGELGRLFESGAVYKQYTAVVHGHVAMASGAVEAPLGKDLQSPVFIKDCVRADGAPAATRFSLQRHYSRGGMPFSILRVTPSSGRKHQIRIHLAHIGHPIVGDKLYGPDEQIYLRFVSGGMTEEDRRAMLVDNQLLHASSVRFDWRQQTWELNAPPPPAWTGGGWL